uniref:Uncharacterized protein n=1 Tax=Oryza sativa subsp. japonica TaxID=39947 RepID=Q6YS42_ORYSJ|nr:hypothetical protein [Oryza sativa Japonica Group]
MARGGAARRSGGDRPAAEGSGVAVTRTAVAAAKRLEEGSPAHSAEWVPVAESDGRGVDGVARTMANAMASTAWLGAAASDG